MENLEIVLSFSGDAPIYEQIESQIRNQILDGTLKAGQAIPSMRTLAKLLRVSVITVQKAYENLKRDGYIESAVGRGTVVAAISRTRILEEKQKAVEDLLAKAVEEAKGCSLSLEQLQDLIRTLYEEGKYD